MESARIFMQLDTGFGSITSRQSMLAFCLFNSILFYFDSCCNAVTGSFLISQIREIITTKVILTLYFSERGSKIIHISGTLMHEKKVATSADVIKVPFLSFPFDPTVDAFSPRCFFG